jgi:phosphate starvation-inducible protein PhoH and related proteins
MIEKTIYLEGVEPLVIYGVNNSNLDRIKSRFPKIRIIARGNEVKVVGDPDEIAVFEGKMDNIINFIHEKNRLSSDDIDQLIVSEETEVITKSQDDKDVIVYGNYGKIVKARTVNQKRLVEEFNDNDLIFAIGPAGTGKTYTAIALAVRSLRQKSVQRIVLTRPAVEAGENLGFLPGDLKEKLDPYLQPLYDALRDMIPPKKLQGYIDENIIEIAPLAFMRGRTLGNAFVILDEGQNTTVNQLKMFLTRMGENSKFIVTGDVTQIDLPKKHQSGLVKAITILKNIDGIKTIEFDTRDIVRHRLVKNIVNAYEKHVDGNNETEKVEKEHSSVSDVK